jgi:hypothetical protein
MNTYMIKVLTKNKGEYGYEGLFIPCYIKVKAMTMYQAELLVSGKYNDGNDYRIDIESSYMLLDEI